MQVPWTVDVRTSGENRLVRTGSPTGVEVYHHDHPTTAEVTCFCLLLEKQLLHHDHIDRQNTA